LIRDHQRAVVAERHVRDVATRSADTSKAYGAICMKLPILVHQAGLAPALHHVAQLSKVEKREILVHLAEQLKDAGFLRASTAEALLKHTLACDASGLLATTREVQRCLEWYRGFAKTILKSSEGADE
jgi:CRISPR/Cas system CMR-associated protein Cmr5 small subunit